MLPDVRSLVRSRCGRDQNLRLREILAGARSRSPQAITCHRIRGSVFRPSRSESDATMSNEDFPRAGNEIFAMYDDEESQIGDTISGCAFASVRCDLQWLDFSLAVGKNWFLSSPISMP